MPEIELKFGAHGSFSIPDAQALGLGELEPLPELNLKAVYYDTFDLRLIRRGITLRFRTGEKGDGNWTLKIPSLTNTSWYERNELDFEGSPRKVPEEVRRLVLSAARSGQIVPVATLRTRRRTWVIKSEAGVELAEIVDDEVSVVEGRRVVARFREIEVEARNGTMEELENLRTRLRDAGAVELEPIPKLVRAIGPQASAPHELQDRPKVGAREPATSVVKAALLAGVDRLIANDPIARLGNDSGVHQMRVATRRLRSDLKTFAPLLDAGPVEKITNELQGLTDALANVREHDVLIKRLATANEDIDLSPLFAELEAERTKAREELDRALSSDDYVDFLDRLVALALDPPFTEAARGKAGDVLPPLVGERWQSLRKKAKTLEVNGAEEDFHAVRILAKKTRYAAEAVVGAMEGKKGKQAARFVDGIAEVQQVLGSHQDSAVACDRLTEAASKSSDPAYSLALGRAIERQIQDSRRQRVSFFSVWDRLDREKNIAWLSG